MGLTGVPRGAGLGTGGVEGWGGKIANGIANAQKCVSYLGCAHVTHEPTRDVVG